MFKQKSGNFIVDYYEQQDEQKHIVCRRCGFEPCMCEDIDFENYLLNKETKNENIN